jgi:hypothetical protein
MKNLKEWQYLNEASKTSIVSSISGTIAELKTFKTYVTYGAISTVIIFLLGFIFGFERPLLEFEGKVSHVIEKQDQDHSRVDDPNARGALTSNPTGDAVGIKRPGAHHVD